MRTALLRLAGACALACAVMPEGAAYAQTYTYTKAFDSQATVFENWMSALKATGSQINTSSQQLGTTMQKAAEANANASQAMMQHEPQLARSVDNLGYSTGQPYKSCLVAPGIATIGTAVAQKNTYQQTIGHRDNQWFEDGGNQSDTLSSQIGLRKTIYCAQSEKDETGDWCDKTVGTSKSGSMPAGNSDATLWLLSRGYGGEEGMTGMDYAETLAPLPTIPALSSSDASATTPASAEIAQKRANAIYQGALMTAARTGIQRTVLEGMQDTELGQATEDETWALNP